MKGKHNSFIRYQCKQIPCQTGHLRHHVMSVGSNPATKPRHQITIPRHLHTHTPTRLQDILSDKLIGQLKQKLLSFAYRKVPHPTGG